MSAPTVAASRTARSSSARLATKAFGYTRNARVSMSKEARRHDRRRSSLATGAGAGTDELIKVIVALLRAQASRHPGALKKESIP